MDFSANRELIYAHEKKFAEKLANRVLQKPKLNVWMILIPVIFIFYFNDFAKYKNQRKEFVLNWLLSRRKALDEALEAAEETRTLDLQPIVDQALQGELSKKAADKYHTLLDVMARHYFKLLNVQGDLYETLVKNAYQNRPGEYRLFLNQLTAAENSLNKALLPQLKKTAQGVKGTIKQIEENAAKLRNREIDQLFS